jgi:tetratricopeptide (TPR) repeat protein
MLSFRPRIICLAALLLTGALALRLNAAPPPASPPHPAVILFTRGEFERARGFFAEEARRAPKQAWPQIGLIRSLLRLDRWEEALRVADNALRVFPESGDLRGLRSLALLRAGRFAEAAADAKQAYQKEPFSFFALLALGSSATWEGNTTLGRTAFLRAIDLRPDDPDAWLGRYESSDKNSGDAQDRTAAQRYLSLNPKGYPHSFRIANIEAVVRHWSDVKTATRTVVPFSALQPVPEAKLRQRERTGGSLTVRIPFEYRLGFVVLPVAIDGVTFRLVFDTGAIRSILLMGDAAKRLKSTEVSRNIVRGANGAETSVQYRAKRLTLGNQKLSLGPVPVDTVGPKFGLGDGVIGGAVFQDWAVTLDFKKKEMVLSRGKQARAPAPAKGNHAISQPFRYKAGKILVPLRVGTEPLWGLLDTGASVDALSLRLAKRLSDPLPRNQVLMGKRALASGIGEQAPEVEYCVFQKPLTVLFDHIANKGAFVHPYTMGLSILDTQVSPVMGMEIGFLMGMPTLRLYDRVTFDYPRRLLTVEGKKSETIEQVAVTQQRSL